jgi:hypothetical protein
MKISYTFFIALLFGVLLTGTVNSQPFTKYKAKDYITAATNYALTNYSPNSTLYAITSGYQLDSTGKASFWLYWFYRPGQGDSSYVVSVTLISPLPPVPVGTAVPSLPGAFIRPLSTNFCNSDASISAAENGGGRQFRQSHPGTLLTGSVYKLPIVPDTSRAYWTYLYADTLGSDFRTYIVDGVTCQLITIGVKSISSEIPDRYILSQNYPNPFNPATNIKFAVPKSGFVKLTVYNAIGEVVENLISEDLEPGVYEVDFDGSGYASGVYFYEFEAKGFTETKRMVLIK